MTVTWHIAVNEPKEKAVPRSVRRAAMDCLARREHSFVELVEKLKERFPESGEREIQSVVSQLREENLQSDARFVEAFIRFRQARGYGYLYIRQALLARGIERELLDRRLFPDDDVWDEVLNEQVARRVLPPGITRGGRDHQRLVRLLLSRGFRNGEIMRALKPRLLTH